MKTATSRCLSDASLQRTLVKMSVWLLLCVPPVSALANDRGAELVRRAERARSAGECQQAVEAARDALRTTSKPTVRFSAYQSLEQSYKELDDDAQLEATFTEHLRVAPDPWTKHNYANFMVRRFRNDEAIELEKSVLAEKDFPAAHHTLATAYRHKADALDDSQHDEKSRLNKLALEADPTDDGAREEIARIKRVYEDRPDAAPATEPAVRPPRSADPANRDGSPTAADLDAYVDQLRAPESLPRVVAAQTLGRAGAAAQRAVPELVVLAGHTDPAERNAAMLALVQIAPRDPAVIHTIVETLPTMDQRLFSQLLPKLRAVGAPVVTAVLQALAKGRVPQHAGESLILDGADFAKQSPAVVDAAAAQLGKALQQSDPATRLNAARTLAAFGAAARAALPALTAALRDKNPTVRTLAANALGAIGPPAAAAVPTLTTLLVDEVPQVSSQARQALVRINDTEASNSSTAH